MTRVLENYGLILLFGLVAVEGCGIPLPGETALIAAGVLASNGHYSIESVIAVAAAGAIIGDNTGYWIGRIGGRALLRRVPLIRHEIERVLPRAERFFGKHGPKTVFVARFVAVLRITAAWLAGVSHMQWWRFAAFDAAGSILWATVFGLVSYEFGRAAADAITHYGFYVVGAVAVVAVLGFVGYRIRRKRRRTADAAHHDDASPDA